MMANCLMADARVNKTNEEQKINTEQHKNQTTNSQIPYFAYNKYTNLCVDQPTEYSLQQVFAFREIIASFISATPIRRALYNGDYYLRRFFFFLLQFRSLFFFSAFHFIENFGWSTCAPSTFCGIVEYRASSHLKFQLNQN